MAGISSKAAGKLENKFKYNGIEHTTELNLNQYDAFYRTLDPQIGRFWQIDPETESLDEYSPYVSMYNNPIINVDPLGNFGSKFGAWLHKVFSGGQSIGQNKWGEWYVRKVSVSEDGSANISLAYGKGRDMYSTASEALVRDYTVMADIEMNGEKSMYQMYDSPKEAGKGALSIGTGVLPIPMVSSGTIAINTAKLASKGRTIIQNISKSLSIQKQARHLATTAKQGGSYLNSVNDAQKVLDAVHS